MPRLMSVAHTTQQVRDRTKTVTRRQGWWVDKNGRRLLHAGDTLTLCEKVMGRQGAPLVRLCDVEVVDVSRVPLWHITSDDVFDEGFPEWSTADFIDFYCGTFGGDFRQLVTRIEFRYLEDQ